MKVLTYDAVVEIDASEIEPHVTWGTNPGMGVPLMVQFQVLKRTITEHEKDEIERALEYMGLEDGTTNYKY